jgi:hypothetical protein
MKEIMEEMIRVWKDKDKVWPTILLDSDDCREIIEHIVGIGKDDGNEK